MLPANARTIALTHHSHQIHASHQHLADRTEWRYTIAGDTPQTPCVDQPHAVESYFTYAG
jgi:hypothetical protein